jgi:hypothetical protein
MNYTEEVAKARDKRRCNTCFRFAPFQENDEKGFCFFVLPPHVEKKRGGMDVVSIDYVCDLHKPKGPKP